MYIYFNFIEFEKVEIDLEHINKGKLGTRKNHISEDNVLLVAQALINNEILIPSGSKNFGQENCSYFAKTGVYKKKKYKIVFCICSDRPDTIGIITLFPIGGAHESL